jgi:Arc/MetJ-type ribon-helix-helix transcriptional regulator
MSKITFRANDDLVSRLEALDASKSEVMREALRSYLDRTEREPTRQPAQTARSGDGETTIDQLVTDRLDQLLDDRLDRLLDDRDPSPTNRKPVAVPDINVHVSLEGVTADNMSVDRDPVDENRKTSEREVPHSQLQSESHTACAQCGELVDGDHVYCPNCGEKATHRLFCECGDEIQSDWGFCPGCGRRTPAADVLDNT